MKARMWGPEYGGLRRNYPPIEFLPSLFRFWSFSKMKAPGRDVLLATRQRTARRSVVSWCVFDHAIFELPVDDQA